MKRFIMILILLAAAAFGMYAAYHYYHDEYLPEQEQKQEIQKAMTLFEELKPEQNLPENDQIPQAEPLTEAPRFADPVSAVFSFLMPTQPEIIPESSYSETDTEPEEEIFKQEEEEETFPEILDLSDIPEMIDYDDNPLETAQDFNSDLIAWLTVPGTEIDYPVVQGTDNAFYLKHGVDKQESVLGVPFLDYHCAPDFSGFTSVLYAHNMEWVLLFARVYSFKQPEFMRTHPYGWLTFGNQAHRVDFIAYETAPDGSDIYHTEFIMNQDKRAYYHILKKYMIHSMNLPSEEELAECHLLLLSTCTFEYQNARGILVGIIR